MMVELSRSPNTPIRAQSERIWKHEEIRTYHVSDCFLKRFDPEPLLKLSPLPSFGLESSARHPFWDVLEKRNCIDQEKARSSGFGQSCDSVFCEIDEGIILWLDGNSVSQRNRDPADHSGMETSETQCKRSREIALTLA